MKKITNLILTANLILMVGLANDASAGNYVCKKVSSRGNEEPIGKLLPAECNLVAPILARSGKFPHIFQSTPPKVLGVCYISEPDGIAVDIGGRAMTVKSANLFTSDFIPAQLVPPETEIETDAIASIIGRWNVTDDETGVRLGTTYTEDTLEMNSGEEKVVITAGTDRFEDATGAVKLRSIPDENGAIEIIHISGEICFKR